MTSSPKSARTPLRAIDRLKKRVIQLGGPNYDKMMRRDN